MIKRGTTVRVLRDTSFWVNNIGTVNIVESNEGNTITYPVVVKFTTPNYAGKFATNFAMDELEIIESKVDKKKTEKKVSKTKEVPVDKVVSSTSDSKTSDTSTT